MKRALRKQRCGSALCRPRPAAGGNCRDCGRLRTYRFCHVLRFTEPRSVPKDRYGIEPSRLRVFVKCPASSASPGSSLKFIPNRRARSDAPYRRTISPRPQRLSNNGFAEVFECSGLAMCCGSQNRVPPGKRAWAFTRDHSTQGLRARRSLHIRCAKHGGVLALQNGWRHGATGDA